MKMQDSPSFLSDPKVVISILALIISLVSLGWTLCNQYEQNRRWEKINNANPELKEVRLINWKEITATEASTVPWGYKPDIYGKGEASDNYVLPYRLIANDSSGNKIEGLNTVFTLGEVEKELHRIQYKGDVTVSKYFRPNFIFENMGKTEAKELSIIIDAKLPDTDWRNAFTSSASSNLAGGQSTTVYFDFGLPINLEVPPQISFRILLKFKDVNNNTVEKNISVKWTTKDNFWSYDEVQKE
ncbi:hypothetical protein [Flavobacterium granuli]|uniref:Uncharacterized protein n=1 Tax=Flavobacterium granuli TaxID=280093 RepID=A0ABU1S3N4_9FLAO|nr:hypothetical protein [Flavobacterium granuli]MDR6845235.1 hypothetical protein [Flavobacterium granuli]